MVNNSGQLIKHKPEKTTSKTKPRNRNLQAEKLKELTIASDILERTDDYVSSYDRNWNIVYINKTTSKYFGRKPEELIGKNFWKTFPNFVGTAVEKNYRWAMEKREIRRFEWKTIYANTGFREFTVFPSAEGIIVYGVDITERKQLQEKLEEHTKNLEKLVEERTKQLQEKERLAAIGATAGMVGHDIRNPLQSIVSSLYLIKEDLGNLSDSKEKTDASSEIESIYEQINYVDKIISDLQDYARPLTPELVEVDLKTLVRSSLSTLNVPDNIEAHCNFGKNLSNIKTDPTLLKRILLNLAINAVQAMPLGGELEIAASQDKKTNNISIIVRDTGVGIPKDLQWRLFTPLFTTKPKGQGLGLAVVKRLVEGLNGKVSFKSEEGKGATFRVELPIKN